MRLGQAGQVWRGCGRLAAVLGVLGMALGLTLFWGIASPEAVSAHVGSPDVYAEGQAGPYKLLVTIRPPVVIPGVAEIEVRSETPGVTAIAITPIPMTGEASKHPPVADAMKQSGADQQFFTGALWIMASGSWQIRFAVDGSQGAAVLSIPLPATASVTRGMTPGLGVVLSGLGLLLVAGVVGIVGAAARDAQLAPGEVAPESKRRRSLAAMGITLAVVIAALWFGNKWWSGEANEYSQYVYRPLTMQATLGPGENASTVLDLKIADPGWVVVRRTDDWVPDHDHLMHLYLIREPGLDVVYHLHPDLVQAGEFRLTMPSVPAGRYRLYADVVHRTGFPETPVAELTVPEIAGRALAGDDAKGESAPISPACVAAPAGPRKFALPDGYTMVWTPPAELKAKTPEVFAFTLLDKSGKAPADMAFYMGMLGHAAFVKADGTVFAHVHPSGTVSMAAMMMAAAQNGPQAGSSTDGMAGMATSAGKLPDTVGFPYGFPTPGAYRIFAQMKHGETVETGIFDACVN